MFRSIPRILAAPKRGTVAKTASPTKSASRAVKDAAGEKAVAFDGQNSKSHGVSLVLLARQLHGNSTRLARPEGPPSTRISIVELHVLVVPVVVNFRFSVGKHRSSTADILQSLNVSSELSVLAWRLCRLSWRIPEGVEQARGCNQSL
jgi:hypothetical protein